jgi:hypothetical protein
MNELALMFFLVMAHGGAPVFHEAPQATPIFVSEINPPRSLLGKQCVTRFGSCTISPRPINTQCFCGKVPGDVR